MSRVAISTLSALLLVALCAGNVVASSPTPASGAVWAPNQAVHYRWHEGNVPPAWMRSAINAAADDSNDSRASKAAVLTHTDSGSSWISYTSKIPTNWAIGYTVRQIPSYFTMKLRPQGYPLDWGNLRWCQFYDSPPTGCFDAEMIVLHEFGHAQTLDHPDDADVTNWTDTVMHWAPHTKAKAGWNMHAFGRCDVARLQIRYDPLTNSTLYSTCLDVDTDLSLASSDSSVSSGSSVTFTTRLTVSADVAWPNLASNALAGRSVIIQRRPAGGSWSNVGSMAGDDSGKYTKTLTISEAYDYRASFATPANEGLNGSTSPVVHVAIKTYTGPCARTGSVTNAVGSMLGC